MKGGALHLKKEVPMIRNGGLMLGSEGQWWAIPSLSKFDAAFSMASLTLKMQVPLFRLIPQIQLPCHAH